MSILKLNSRRSFLWKFGAGASTVLASTAALAGRETATASTTVTDPALQVALLQEERVLRRFHQVFEQAMDRGLYAEVIGMFADDAEVVFNGGVFKQLNQGVSRLYRDRFQAGMTGRRMEPAPGFELTANQQRDRVEVAVDRKFASAVFPYSIQVGVPLESDSSLVAMARLHGEGVRTWWEGGEYKVAYRKDVAGNWRIGRLEYDTLARADYRSGKRYAQPISVARLTMRFPEDPLGPDELA
jgi:hypothetical protein